jgi:hypothetical protein
MTASVVLSVTGLAVHNTREFGVGGLADPATGTLPMLVVGLVVFIVWWRVPRGRLPAALLLAAYGLLNLIGGAVISVLPLSFLPYEPDQSLYHYFSHTIYGLTQLPLIWMGIRQAWDAARGIA